MTVSSDKSKAGPFIADGVNTEFEFDFRILDGEEIRVVQTVDGVDADVDPIDYTVTFDETEGSVDFDVAPADGVLITILRNMKFTQEAAISNSGDFYPKTHEEVFDRLTMQIQQVKETADRGVQVSPASDTDPQDLVTEILDARNTAVSAAATATGAADSILNDAGFIAVAADLTGADTIGTVAADLAGADNIGTVATNIASVIAAPGAAVAAENSAIAAAQSEANVEALLASAMFRDVVFITAAQSPFSVTQSHNGAMISVDTSGGAVSINLPQISSLTLPFVLGVKKTSGDGNTVTINRAGSDTIDGGTTKVVSSAGSGATLIPDVDPSPDGWTSADFGAAAGNMVVDTFVGDGVTVDFPLSVAPGSKNNTSVIVGGVPQFKSSYSVVGTTLTFAAPPANGVGIEVTIGTTLSIGVPGDGTVSAVKVNAGDAANIRTALGLGSAAIAPLIDDDTFATALPTNVPSAESVKAYIYSQNSFPSLTKESVTVGTSTNVQRIAPFSGWAILSVTSASGVYRISNTTKSIESWFGGLAGVETHIHVPVNKGDNVLWYRAGGTVIFCGFIKANMKDL